MIDFSPSTHKMDQSNPAVLALILRHLPKGESKPDLVTDIEVVWTMRLGAVRGSGVLIVYTARDLTCDGGNGWTGLDGNDLAIIQTAVRRALNRNGGGGLIDRFVVRGQQSRCKLNTKPGVAPMVDTVDDSQPWLPGLL